MSIAAFVCMCCALMGWHFISNMLNALNQLHAIGTAPTSTQVIAALLPGVPGVFLWSVAIAFLIFTVIKLDPPWKQQHLGMFIFAMKIGQSFLWLTVPIAIAWLLGNFVLLLA